MQRGESISLILKKRTQIINLHQRRSRLLCLLKFIIRIERTFALKKISNSHLKTKPTKVSTSLSQINNIKQAE